jgi:hypothetical protein
VTVTNPTVCRPAHAACANLSVAPATPTGVPSSQSPSREKLAYVRENAISLALPMHYGSRGRVKGMNKYVLEISTPVFRMLRRRVPVYVSWSDEKVGPTQRIVVDDDVYSEMIDRAIAKRKTIDEVFLEVGTRS